MMNWLRRKETRYTVKYYARGFMGNAVEAGTFTFTVTPEELKEHGNPQNVGFFKHEGQLLKHFDRKADTIEYHAEVTEL